MNLTGCSAANKISVTVVKFDSVSALLVSFDRIFSSSSAAGKIQTEVDSGIRAWRDELIIESIIRRESYRGNTSIIRLGIRRRNCKKQDDR